MVHFADINHAPPPQPLINVAAYCKTSNNEACTKKLSQILANNIDIGGKMIGLRIYVRYCISRNGKTAWRY